MQEHPYTKREEDDFRQRILKDLNDIKCEVKKTNGRVRTNEKLIWLAIGGLGVLSFIVTNDLIAL